MHPSMCVLDTGGMACALIDLSNANPLNATALAGAEGNRCTTHKAIGKDTGYRNKMYMMLLEKCLVAVDPVDQLLNPECYYHLHLKDKEGRKRTRVSTSLATRVLLL